MSSDDQTHSRTGLRVDRARRSWALACLGTAAHNCDVSDTGVAGVRSDCQMHSRDALRVDRAHRADRGVARMSTAAHTCGPSDTGVAG